MCQKGELKSDVKNDANDGVDGVVDETEVTNPFGNVRGRRTPNFSSLCFRTKSLSQESFCQKGELKSDVNNDVNNGVDGVVTGADATNPFSNVPGRRTPNFSSLP